MFKLINEEDRYVINNGSFAKNAIFYKDMMAFYIAYQDIMERDDGNLPNFCYLHNKKYCLEGICLLIKMYATEFKFETIKLSLDYLKILYYSIASYSTDGQTVDSDLFVKEFFQYREASIDYCEKNKFSIEEKTAVYEEKRADLNKWKNMSKKHHVASKVLNFFYVFMFVFTFISLVVPSMMAYYGKATKPVIAGIVVGIIAVGMVISHLFKFFSKKQARKADDIAYIAQTKKKECDVSFAELKTEVDRLNRIICERYEYNTFFSELFSRYTKVLSINQIVEKAQVYSLLTYNMVEDVKTLFVNMQNEINEIISRIENTKFGDNYQQNMADIYRDILKQDYFYYNTEVRLHFIKRLSDFSEKQFYWKLNFDGEEINPFDVDVRELSREKISFQKVKGGKLINANLTEFMNTKYARTLTDLEFSGSYNADSLKTLKTNYINHFYNHDVMGVASSETLAEKFNISLNNLAGLEKIPTYIVMKLRLIETNVGLSNSDASVIKQLAESLFGEMSDSAQDADVVESVVEFPSTDCDEFEDLGETVRFVVDGQEIIGHKIK